MKVQHLIGKLRHTQAAMRETAVLMRPFDANHADQMEGAANIVDSWIAGLQPEAASSAVPRGVTVVCSDEPKRCVTCGEEKPFTGSCGTGPRDAKALCKQPGSWRTDGVASGSQASDEGSNS